MCKINTSISIAETSTIATKQTAQVSANDDTIMLSLVVGNKAVLAEFTLDAAMKLSASINAATNHRMQNIVKTANA